MLNVLHAWVMDMWWHRPGDLPGSTLIPHTLRPASCTSLLPDRHDVGLPLSSSALLFPSPLVSLVGRVSLRCAWCRPLCSALCHLATDMWQGLWKHYHTQCVRRPSRPFHDPLWTFIYLPRTFCSPFRRAPSYHCGSSHQSLRRHVQASDFPSHLPELQSNTKAHGGEVPRPPLRESDTAG